ncbi:class F sortase [Pseudalkalibacillus berkeleyi]|uniref:Class F sortase n=1 Tax=Pseudalkalibacillus berkeleyi TaxID=1069813 RepID=A0ABS9H0S4_9BACL|nr:class F sortase [Pseudalkalibacillus berkeleyi]MCF6138602.1 class F sortase [Pseudalkalibacillus berkeleyi]
MKKTLQWLSLLLLAFALAGCMNPTADSKENQMQVNTSTQEQSTTNEEKDQSNSTASGQSTENVDIIKDERKGIVPVSIEIPSINVKTKVEHVGTLDDGRMDVPKDADNVGWYKPGTLPGAQGNSVIAGHVDDLTSPAVFYDLHKLKDGDKIIVKGKSGETLTFKVNQSKVYPRQDSPIENIFGYTYRSALNLITCTGDYDPKTTERAERLVVTAELVQG